MAADLDNLRRYQRQMLLDLPLGVCSLGVADEIVMWNHAMERLTGIKSTEVMGLQLQELDEPWLSLLMRFVNNETTHLYKQYFQLNGRRRSVNLHKAVIEKSRERAPTPDGVIILVEDMTETELLEASLTHSERLASIGRLAAGVAHEIGNPITGIACLAQTIRDEFADEELRHMAEQIIEQTNRTSRIVQSLVNFAHAGSNKTADDRVPVSVSDSIDEAITLVSLDKKARAITYVVDCEPDLQVMGDSQRLLQVLLNLINNARDASRSGSTITLTGRRVHDQIEIAVSDDGVGIAPAIRDRIFDPFFTTKEAGEGTGLGLSLVFSIVEDMFGNIDIISPTNPVTKTGTGVVLSCAGVFEENKDNGEGRESRQTHNDNVQAPG